METTDKILLNSAVNKKSVNKNVSLNINLSGDKKILPGENINAVLDSYDVYVNERSNSNKFRLIFNINSYCSNVLFNPFSEIVKYEGSSSALCLNYEAINEVKENKDEDKYTGGDIEENIKENIVGKSKDFKWNQYKAIRDTQLSNEICGFDYHCGVDIFNNHVLRNKTFKCVSYTDKSDESFGYYNDAYDGLTSEKDDYRNVKINENGTRHKYLIDSDFNTIDDYMRDRDGVIVSENFDRIKTVTQNSSSVPQNELTLLKLPLHLYQKYDTRTFEECYEDKLMNDNGWYGFINSSTVDGNISGLTMNRVLNNREYCEFIDLYPTRDLYSFVPKYNSYRNRVEKNWNYCITYPSESVIYETDGKEFSFFKVIGKKAALRAYMFDEKTKNDNGLEVVTIYSIAQHGLKNGDFVNIYKGDTVFYDSSKVINVVNKYIFQIEKTKGDMSSKWIKLDARTLPLYDGNKYPVCESSNCNVDDDAQEISFKRVVSNVECEYYVRKFSRLPNFKFKDEEINDYNLYDGFKRSNLKKNNKTLIERFSDPSDKRSEFESHISRLGFANTSYGDETAELVFTDDINVSHLKDNLGRPLSELYLTIVKNNKGYKQWYGMGGEPVNIKTDKVEYSHCFGKVNSSFLFSEYFREATINGAERFGNFTPDVRDIVSTDGKGLSNVNDLGNGDEIVFDEDMSYWGDICCYSPIDCDEQSIQKVMHRFNTVQREIANSDALAARYFAGIVYGTSYPGGIIYDEIEDDEYSIYYSKLEQMGVDPYEAFKNGRLHHTMPHVFTGLTNSREGYYYQPHYRIPIKTVSQTLSSDNAIKYDVILIELGDTIEETGRQTLLVETRFSHYLTINDKLTFYQRSTNKFFYVTVTSLCTENAFYCIVSDEEEVGLDASGLEEFIDINNLDDFVLLKRNESTPSYAKLVKDGSCRYYWREIKANGIENDPKIYPFTNGAFYITQQINFFLRRQDPEKTNLAVSYSNFDYTPEGSIYSILNTENKEYVPAEDIDSCMFDMGEMLFGDVLNKIKK